MLFWIAAASAATLTVRAPAFPNGATIPTEYTCVDEDASPMIVWAGAPATTQTYAVVVDDPDGKDPAGAPWVHWVVYNIPANAVQLDRNILVDDKRFLQGTNDFKQPAWGGPCPPAGKGAHRYMFRVYALDTTLALVAGASRTDVDAAMKGHILASGTVMGRYER